VLKSDAYGHGAVEVGRLLDPVTDYFGVSIIEEAMELRRAGIIKPILIFGYTSPAHYEKLFKYDIDQTVFDLNMAQELSKAANLAGKKVRIHLEVDTGMARTGLKCDESGLEAALEIGKLENLEIAGIFTHFANADLADKAPTLKQKQLFEDFYGKLEERGLSIPLKHACNSAATIDEDENYDMVRTGLALYGLYPSEEVKKHKLNLKPAMCFKTHVIFIKEILPGQGVSYGHTYVAKTKRKIATLPVGYADGYPRALSSKGRVLIKGKYAPIVGRVCMDLMMVDVTGIDGIELEEDVVLMGCQAENCISAEELGLLSGTINYEIICGISKRVPKVLYKGGKEHCFLSSFEEN
jgi:alanine racemase